VSLQRPRSLALLLFGLCGLSGHWSSLPPFVVLVALAWLPGSVALHPCRTSCFRRHVDCPVSGPGAVVFESCFSLLLATAAVLPSFLLHADLASAVGPLASVYVVLGAAGLSLDVRAGSRSDRVVWAAWCLALMALLPAVLHYAGGTVDDWWDLAFVRAYADRAALDLTEPVLGTGKIHPRFAWNAWLVLQALVARVTRRELVDLQAELMAPLACVLTVSAAAAFARSVFGARRSMAITSTLLFVPCWLYGTEALPYFTRLHQDKFVVGLAIVPAMLSATVAYLRYGGASILALVAVTVLSATCIHGLLFAIGALAVAVCMLSEAGVPAWQARSPAPLARCLPIAFIVAVAMVYPIWQAATVHGWFTMQGVTLDAPDNPVVRAHLWLQRLLWPHEGYLVVDPRAVFGLVALPALGGLVAAWQRRSHDAGARTILLLTLIPSALIFVPFVASVTGRVLIPWMLYRLGWLVPVPLLIGLLCQAVWQAGSARERSGAIVRGVALAGVACLAVALTVPAAADRIRRDMAEHPGSRQKQPRGTTRQLLQVLARRPLGGTVIAPPAISNVIPASTGQPVVAISERGTLVFSGDERDAYERLRDRARFFSPRADAAERRRIAAHYGATYAVFRRRLVPEGEESAWFESAGAEGFLLAMADGSMRLWSADEPTLRSALPSAWRVVYANRDFFLVQIPSERAEAVRDERDTEERPEARWLSAFDVSAPTRRPPGAGVLASMVGFPGAEVRFDPPPLSLGISDRPVWTAGNLLWEDGPAEVAVTIHMTTPCRVEAAEIVPFLRTERREVFEVEVGAVRIRRPARDGKPLVVPVRTPRSTEVTIRVRSLLGVPFGLSELRLLGDPASCDGGWRPLPRSLWPDQALPLADLLRQAREYPYTARAMLPVARRIAERGNERDARTLLRQALTREPASSPAWVELGLLRDAAGMPEAARSAYGRAITADSNSAWAHGCLAWSDLRGRRLVGALYHGWRALRLDPRYADAYTIVAGAVERVGDDSRARSLLREAIALDPRRDWAYMEMVRLDTAAGRSDDAVETLTALLANDPNHRWAREMKQRLTANRSGDG